MKILNFGSCNIDYVYSVDHIVAPGETETTSGMNIFPGGKGLNQSIAAARAGAAVYHAGCIGKDGELLADVLEKSGVDLSYVDRVDEKNGHAIIQVSEKGENSIFLYPGSNAAVTKEYIDGVIESFDEETLVLLQNEISNVDYIVRRAHEKGMKIMLNPSPFNEEIAKIDLSLIDYLILNEVEAAEISGEDEPGECLKRLKERFSRTKIILTLGKNGCIYSDTEKEITQAAFCVKAVDTTAAGDTFTGYLLAGMAENEKTEESLKRASAASAIAVSKAGAAPSIPKRDEVEEFLNKNG